MSKIAYINENFFAVTEVYILKHGFSKYPGRHFVSIVQTEYTEVHKMVNNLKV